MSNHTNHTVCSATPFRPPTAHAAVVIQLDNHSFSSAWTPAKALSQCTNNSNLSGLFLYGNETSKLVPRHEVPVDIDGFCWQYGLVGSCNATADAQLKCFYDALGKQGVNAAEKSWCFAGQDLHEAHKGEGFKGGVKGWVVLGLAVVAVLGGM